MQRVGRQAELRVRLAEQQVERLAEQRVQRAEQPAQRVAQPQAPPVRLAESMARRVAPQPDRPVHHPRRRAQLPPAELKEPRAQLPGAVPTPGVVALPIFSGPLLRGRPDVEPDEDTLGIGQVADDLAHRLRQPSHRRRNRDPENWFG